MGNPQRWSYADVQTKNSLARDYTAKVKIVPDVIGERKHVFYDTVQVPTAGGILECLANRLFGSRASLRITAGLPAVRLMHLLYVL